LEALGETTANSKCMGYAETVERENEEIAVTTNIIVLVR
jgi:hypothetical protein